MNKGEANLMSMGYLGWVLPTWKGLTATCEYLIDWINSSFCLSQSLNTLQRYHIMLFFHFKVSAFYNLSFTTVLVRGSKYETQSELHFISTIHIVYFSQVLSQNYEFLALSAWLRVFAKISCSSLLLYDALFAQFCTIYSYAKMQ